jgi:hypothetical protein
MPKLRTRKIIYAVLVMVGSAVWLPLMLLGFIVAIGAVGLLCVAALLRCIYALPVEDRFSRSFYSAMIAIGVLLLGGCLVVVASSEPPFMGAWSLLGSGGLLIAVALAVLKEMHASRA